MNPCGASTSRLWVLAGVNAQCCPTDGSDVLAPSCRQTVARWQKALKGVPWLTATDSLQPEKSAVSEELNVAWARHEIISDNVDEVRCCPPSQGSLS